MTKIELITKVQTFYNGSVIDFDKAMKIYEIEYGYKPEINDIKKNHCVNSNVLEKYNIDECVTVETLEFMKELQASGAVNMMMSNSNVRQVFGYSKHQASAVVQCYAKHYTELYNIEDLV